MLDFVCWNACRILENGPEQKGTTYQVRYASDAADGGYVYKTFTTRKAAREFLDKGLPEERHHVDAKPELSVRDAIQKWLDVCEYEGREGKDPVAEKTVVNYEWRADIMKRYPWQKQLDEEGPDVVAFRSWLLRNYSRDTAKKVLSSFHSVLLEMGTQGVLKTDPAAGVTIQKSRYDFPLKDPFGRRNSGHGKKRLALRAGRAAAGVCRRLRFFRPRSLQRETHIP